jgi:hypothetical protein
LDGGCRPCGRPHRTRRAPPPCAPSSGGATPPRRRPRPRRSGTDPRLAAVSSTRCNARLDTIVGCRDGGWWPWRPHHTRRAPPPRAPSSGGATPPRRRPRPLRSGPTQEWPRAPQPSRALGATRGYGHEDEAKINVLISIYGYAAMKQMAKYVEKPLKIKENSSMRGKSFGGLPPPEPPRTVKGPPLRGGSRCATQQRTQGGSTPPDRG